MNGDKFIKCAFCIFAFLVLSAQSPVSPFDVEGLPGTRAPQFSLKDAGGTYVSLTTLRGKVVVLNFWSTWCPPCRDEIPSLNRLYERYGDNGLVVLGVSTGSPASQVRGFLKDNAVSYPVLLDGLEVSRLYKVYTIPSSFLIDRGGVIVERYLGEKDWSSPEITEKIETLLR